MNLDFFSDINQGRYEDFQYGKVDRLMIKVLWWHFAFVSILTLFIYFFSPSVHYPSPLSLRILTLTETLSAILIAGVASAVPTLLKNKLANHYHYRILITNCLFIFSYLLVFVSGGSIESHFHFFAIIALLCVYSDWRLGWIGALVISLHHFILNFVQPAWVYQYGRDDIALISHALPVLLTALFTTWITNIVRANNEKLAFANKELGAANDKLAENNDLLKDNMDQLQKMNTFMMGREIKMAELKKQIGEIEKGELTT